MIGNAQRPTCTSNPSIERLKSAIISAAGKYATEAAKNTPDNNKKQQYLLKVWELSQKYKELNNGQ